MPRDNVDEPIGRKLRNSVFKGLTVAEVAKRLHFSRPNVSNILLGTRHISVEMSSKIEDVFKVSGEEILKYQAAYHYRKHRGSLREL